MKKQFWIVVMTILSIAMCGKAASDSTVGTGNIHMCLVVDCGKADMSTWETMRARAIEMVCLLKTGDRITIINAYPSEARLFESAELLSDNKTPVDRMVKRLGTLSKDWFVRGDVSAAVGLSYEKLIFEPKGQNCCIVLTSGDITDDQVRSLTRLSVMFKAKNWPIVLLCEHTTANRQLLVSGIEVRYLDNPGISEWIGSIRPVVKNKPEPNLPSSPRPAQEPERKTLSNTPVDYGRDLKIKSDKTPRTLPEQKKPETARPKPTPTPKILSPMAGDPHIRLDVVVKPKPNSLSKDDANKAALPSPLKKIASKDCKPDKPKDSDKPQKANSTGSDTKNGFFARWYFWVLAAIGVILLIVAYAYFKTAAGRKVINKATDDAEVPKSLVVYIGDDRRELGSLRDIREIIIGSGLGSTIFVSGEGIAAQHLKISSFGSSLKLQNCSDAAITVGGLSVKPKGKVQLDLPAEIELTQNVSVVLIEEECK